MDLANAIARDMLAAQGVDSPQMPEIDFGGVGDLPSAFAVSDFACASIAAAASAIAMLISAHGSPARRIAVDRRLSSFWFKSSIRPTGWELPSPWDPIAGDYECKDGWIRLHTNAPSHRAAAERVLGVHPDKTGMGRAVRTWAKTALESEIVDAGGCAAEMRSMAAWSAHAQGSAVAKEALVATTSWPAPMRRETSMSAERPLAGIRVLDLTRVLAGPVASRFLAGYGAQVLRIDPPDWDEPGLVPEVNAGKRSARLDLRSTHGRTTILGLLETADVLLHGYRPGALEALGLGEAVRRDANAGLIDVALDAYGWTGPWAGRRGFDSLVQMSCGIAEAGQRWGGAQKPLPLPMQALDHATGYLMASAAVLGLERRLRTARSSSARLSLARTAALLMEHASCGPQDPFAPETADDVAPRREHTSWGDAMRLRPPVDVPGAPMRWDTGSRRLGSDEPRWPTD